MGSDVAEHEVEEHGFGDDDEDPHTPCVNLSSIFDSLRDTPVLPLVSGSASFSTGWSHDDLGGDGLCLMDAFSADVQQAQQTSSPTSSSCDPSVNTINWQDIPELHPNKIFALAIQYIGQRVAASLRSLRAKKSKGPHWRLKLRALVKDPMSDLRYHLSARQRSDAYYMMTAWVSRLSGRSIREVRPVLAESWVNQGKWKLCDEKVKCRFHFLKETEKCDDFQAAFPELFATRILGRSTQTSLAIEAASATEALPVTLCHGYLATYNTNLGLHDPTILQWVQQGLRGSELAAKLKGRDLLKDAFDRFVVFQKALAAKVGFEAWAVAMEHSANGQQPARVHLHVYAGTNVRGGHLFMGTPKATPVKKESLQWEGCAAPMVRFTVIRRPSPATILNGVASGMYYVAGAKKSNLFLEASMYPFEDRALAWYVERAVTLSSVDVGLWFFWSPPVDRCGPWPGVCVFFLRSWQL